MKITTKIAAGYGGLLALILAVLTYQLSFAYQMRSINQNLSEINFRAALVSLQLLRDLDQVEEFTQKFFATGADAGYASQLGEMRNAFSQALQGVQSLPLSASEEKEVDGLSELWRKFLEAGAQRNPPLASSDPRRREARLHEQAELLRQLRVQTQSLNRAARLAIQSRVQESARAAQRAERISWITAAVALAVSLLVSFWTFRSISRPLKQLREGTHAVAEGKFSYRLDDTGRDELSQLANDFNSMTRRLDQLDELKKDFVSHVSHELKSPLASVRETLRLLLEEIPGPLVEPQRRLMQLSLQSCNRLSSMIENLLDLSRIEAGVMEYEIKEADLAASIRRVMDEFAIQMGEKRLRVEARLPERPLLADCDGDRILQVLGNVFGNALKFSPPATTIQVRLQHLPEMPEKLPEAWRHKVAAASHGSGFALVSVADSGPGIPDSEKQKIFEKFHRVRQGSKFSGQGAGLGLAIGRTIVEAHQGAIWVENNPGGGSVFYILLAARTLPEKAPAPVSSPI